MHNKLTQKEYLVKVDVIIENSLEDAAVIAIMKDNGYPGERIEKEGKLLKDTFRALFNQHQKDAARSEEAVKQFQKIHKQADDYFAKMVKMARIVLKDDSAALKELGIKGSRERTIVGWLIQADQFFTHALASSSLQEKLAACGITRQKLVDGSKMVENVRTLHRHKEMMDGQAQMSTKAKDKTFNDLKEWGNTYSGIAKIALSHVPQLMEKIGLLERS